jgi:hypothetical protein
MLQQYESADAWPEARTYEVVVDTLDAIVATVVNTMFFWAAGETLACPSFINAFISRMCYGNS